MEKIVQEASDGGAAAPTLTRMFDAIADAIQGLGLKLTLTKALVEILAIDHAEKPGPN